MKNIAIKLTLIAMIFGMTGNLSGQIFLPEEVIAKYENGYIYVRWEPSSLEEYEISKTSGYTVRVNDISTSSVKDPSIDFIVKPLPYGEWPFAMESKSSFKQQFYQGCQNMIYPEEVTDEDQKIENALPGQQQSTMDSFKMGLILYSATYDFDLAEKTGLAYKFRAKQGHQYTVDIECPGFDNKSITLDAVIETNEVPDMMGKWGDKLVTLSWNSLPYTKTFFGYMIERSRDGINFKMNDSIPNVNTLEKYAEEGDTESIYSRKDSLEVNYETYYFRLRGFDYFGRISNKFSVVIGNGFDVMTLSPSLIFADQTEDNEAHLKWQVPEQEEHMVKSFTVLRADSIKGEYSVAKDSIDKYAREIKIPIKNTINYYRIEANPEQGDSKSSMPVLVMGQDTVPPLKPKMISAQIDSVGNVNVTWFANQEPDLWGYRIYKANFGDDEFSLLNSYPVLDTVFIDSVDIDLGNKDVYYLVQAADKRNNRSPYSDTIKLELPDVIPPSSPLISRVELIEDSVKVHFVRSMSDDVVYYAIFRRDIKEEEAWSMIAEFDTSYTEDIIMDGSVQTNHQYAYTMIARDEAGLESKPKHFKQIFIDAIEEDFVAFKSISQEIDKENNTVTIKWDCNDPERLKSILVYRGNSKDRMSKYKYVDAPDMELVDEIKEGSETVYYRLKPSFYEQKKHLFSDFIVVTNPKFEEKMK